MSDDPINPVTEEAEAIDRIARTHDGRLLHRYLRRVLETVADIQDTGALQSHNGRRTLARDLMRLMAPGIEGTSDRGDHPILSRAGKPVAARAGSRAEQRRAIWAAERGADTSTGPGAA